MFTIAFASLGTFRLQSSSNAMVKISFEFLDTLVSRRLEMELSLLMFIESPLTQTDNLILIPITTINIRPAQQQLFCTEP